MKRDSWMIVVCEWIWRGIFVNLCWITFSAIGLGIFGFFPASIALFTIIRKWLRKETDFQVWKTFKQVYFQEWKRSNQIGLVFYSIGLLLYIDIRLIEGFMSGVFASFLTIILSIIMLILFIAVGYFFAVYVHYELSNKEYIKQSFLIALTSLPSTIGIGAGFFVIGSLLINQMPGLIPFISAVAPAFWIMKVCLNRFAFLEKRVQQQLVN